MTDVIICQDCKQRPFKVKFSEEPVFAMTHGFDGTKICRQCYIKRIEEELIVIQTNLKQQKDLLRKELFKERQHEPKN